MKSLKYLVLLSLLVLPLSTFSNNNNAGFYLPDSLQEMSINFRTVDNLIVLPVSVNDSVHVNLILDTGCRNIVLFGKRFKKLLNIRSGKPVIFSGLGTGASVKGSLSINNKVTIHSVLGKLVPVIIVPDKNLFSQYRDIDGVIGYDIFLKFEIEINSKEHRITFRKALTATPPDGYSQVPLKIVDSRPVMQSNIIFENKSTASCDLMIDTGSAIGLLLKTTDLGKYHAHEKPEMIGMGLNGALYGFTSVATNLQLGDFVFSQLNVGIVKSDWHNHASIGMDVLKDYIVVLNYCKSYACFRSLS